MSATLHVAHLAGIRVMVTGGIGGVHHGAERTGDVSEDLAALARTPVAAVSSGTKAIRDGVQEVRGLVSRTRNLLDPRALEPLSSFRP